MISPYTQHNYEEHQLWELAAENHPRQSTDFALNIAIKDPSFVIGNDIFEK